MAPLHKSFSLRSWNMRASSGVAGLTLILVIVIFAVPCCKVSDTDLLKNKRIWSEGNVRSYDFKIKKRGGAVSDLVPVLVHVRAGEAVSIEPLRNAGDDEDLKGYGEFDTIEKCFIEIQRSYDEGYKVKVEYNSKFGYPEHIWVQDISGSDNFYLVEISGFTTVY